MTKEKIKLEQELLNNKLIGYLHYVLSQKYSELEIKEVIPVLTGLYVRYKEKGKIQVFGRLISFITLGHIVMSTEEFTYLYNSDNNSED